MALNNHIYSDLDLTFRRTPGKNDVALSYDEVAVIRSVKNLLYTNKYDRLFQPQINSGIRDLLFEPVNPITASVLQDQIIRTITNYESRVTIDNVTVVAFTDNNYFNVTISVFIGNNVQPTSFNIILKRVR